MKKVKRIKATKSVTLWLSRVGNGAPSNAPGPRVGLGETKEQASAAAGHWNNQAPREEFKQVSLSDWPRMVDAPSEETELAFRCLDERDSSDGVKVRGVGRLLDAGKYASAWEYACARGRPSEGLSQVAVNFRLPADLADRARAAAESAGAKQSEWWRRAALAYLAAGAASVLDGQHDASSSRTADDDASDDEKCDDGRGE